MTRDELAMQFALVLLRNPTMQDMAPIYFRERAYQYADAFLEEPEDDEEEPDDGEPAAPAPRRAWRVVPGPNAKLRHLTECPNRDAAIVALDRARARGDAEAVMERWQEGWVREEPRMWRVFPPPGDEHPTAYRALAQAEKALRGEHERCRREARLQRSDDDGATWVEMTPPGQVQHIETATPRWEDVDALHTRYMELTERVAKFREALGLPRGPRPSDEEAIARAWRLSGLVTKFREAAGVDAQISDGNAVVYVRKLREAAAQELQRATAAVSSPSLVQELVEALRMNDVGHTCILGRDEDCEEAITPCPACMRKAALEKAGSTP